MERPFPAYKGDAPYIFVSYSHEDDAVVYPEIQWLNDQGFNIWYDEGINPGSEWHQALADSIDNASLFLYFVTPNSVVSDHCQREVHYAIDHKKQLLAIHLEETELPSGLGLSLSSIQAILRHELGDQEYRLKLLKGTGDHIQRGIAQVAAPAPSVTGLSPLVTGAFAIAGLVLGAVVATVVSWQSGPEVVPSGKHVMRFEIDLEPGDPTGVGQSLAITGDGSRILFTGQGDAGRQVFVRALDDLSAVPIRGTEPPSGQEGAGSFALSPDSEWIAYNSVHDLTMKKVRVSGGTPITLTSVGDAGQRGLDWGSNDMVVISPSNYNGLTKVSARGGKSEPLTTPEEGINDSDPHFLRDGEKLLFTRGIYGKLGAEEVVCLTLATGEVKTLLPGAYPRVTASDHLLFLREGSLWAAGFDNASCEVTTEAVPVVERVARYGVSDEGSLVYWGGDVAVGFGAPRSNLVWLDQQGNVEPLDMPPDRYIHPQVSPDGSKLAVLIATDRGVRDLWVYTLARGTLTRLTFDDAVEFSPTWSPDSRQVAFASDRDATVGVYVIAADGTGGARRLTSAKGADFHAPVSWSQDGDRLIILSCPNGGACDPAVLSVTEEGNPITPLLETAFNEDGPTLSPDGRWLAYSSNESGQEQIFVRPYPNVSASRWQVSSDGGEDPTWSPDGKTLYYVGPAAMMAVDVEAGDSFVPGTPRLLFDLHDFGAQFGGYSVTPDGERFLTGERLDQETGRTVVVLNWFEELGRVVPMAGQ